MSKWPYILIAIIASVLFKVIDDVPIIITYLLTLIALMVGDLHDISEEEAK